MPSRSKEFMSRILFNYSARNWSYGFADLIYKFYLYPQLSGKQGLFHNPAESQRSAPDVEHKRCCVIQPHGLQHGLQTWFSSPHNHSGERAPFNTHLLVTKSTCLKSVYLIQTAVREPLRAYQEGIMWSKVWLRGIKAEINKIENKTA